MSAPLVEFRPGSLARVGEVLTVPYRTVSQRWVLRRTDSGLQWMAMAPVIATDKPRHLLCLRIHERTGRRYFI